MASDRIRIILSQAPQILQNRAIQFLCLYIGWNVWFRSASGIPLFAVTRTVRASDEVIVLAPRTGALRVTTTIAIPAATPALRAISRACLSTPLVVITATVTSVTIAALPTGVASALATRTTRPTTFSAVFATALVRTIAAGRVPIA
ncbi:hypothetical protein CEPID_05925 [Corynebacterium epidermidicanis]|uniref:Uncharacterized protein n=1 Tax=Corynebacterium epidermidicanis TaxID=1050174 RepID=A0A0G3GP93_9CORY|nr:hypothetical protein CEPID_05925 [Corynebacterium epidermidicanis]